VTPVPGPSPLRALTGWKILGGLILTVVGVGLFPLTARGELVDRIAAVVDAEPILESEVDEAVWLYRAQMGISPDDTTGLRAFRRQVLDQLIDEKLLVAKAQREGMTIGTKELSTSLDWAVQEMRSSFGSEDAFRDALEREGLTVQSLKDRYRKTVRQQLLARRVMEIDLQSKVRVEPGEVLAFYESHRDSIPPIPEQIELLTALVRVDAAPEVRNAARRRAGAVLDMIRGGKDFSEAAMEFSDGPEGQRGGDIGFFRRGDLGQVPEFENLAFSLGVGECGGPAETPLGFHLIQTTDRDDDRVRVSQILFRLEASRQDTLRSRHTADAVRKEMAGGASLEALRSSYGEDGKVEVEILGPMSVTDLRSFYRDAVGKLDEGQTSDVLAVPEGFQVLTLIDRVPAREPSFEDIEPQLNDLLARRRMEEAYRKWVAELREEIYIKIMDG